MSYADPTHVPTELRNKIEMELRSGERIVWSAQPIAQRFSRGSWLIVLFGIPFLAFSVFWITMAGHMSTSAPGPFKLFPLFGVPFVLIGAGLITSPIWMRKVASGTVYFITDQRAVIMAKRLTGGLRVESFAPDQLQSITREENNDGSGNLIFISRTWRDTDGDRRTQRIGFIAVADVKTVEAHIRALADKSTTH